MSTVFEPLNWRPWNIYWTMETIHEVRLWVIELLLKTNFYFNLFAQGTKSIQCSSRNPYLNLVHSLNYFFFFFLVGFGFGVMNAEIQINKDKNEMNTYLPLVSGL